MGNTSRRPRVGAPEGEIDSVYAETRALAEHGVSARSRVILENSYGFVKGLCGRLAEGRRAVVEATRLAEELGDPELIAGTGYTRMAIMLVGGEFRELNVLTQNADALRLSTYFFKTREGKLEFGPIWDFDRSMHSTDGRDANATASVASIIEGA